MNAPTQHFIDRFHSPLGALDVVWSRAGLHLVQFAESAGKRERTLARLRLRPQPAALDHTDYGEALADYFAGRIEALDAVPVATQGSAFQCAVWNALREIPAGATLSYGALAERIGRERASRAVGRANASNPIAIAVPCHRVIGADGRVAGYAGGTDRKRWLLRHEGVELDGDDTRRSVVYS
jgi:methylated-DNA-[protein]-cysteine S-methyltransferase